MGGSVTAGGDPSCSPVSQVSLYLPLWKHDDWPKVYVMENTKMQDLWLAHAEEKRNILWLGCVVDITLVVRFYGATPNAHLWFARIHE